MDESALATHLLDYSVDHHQMIISKLPGQPDISGSMVLSLAAARVLDGLSYD